MATYTITALDPTKPEGDAGPTQFRFQIDRAGPFNPNAEFERVNLKLDTPDIDGFDGFSFDGADGRVFGRDDNRLGVRFDQGETSKIITVTVQGDTLVENNELIRLSLTSYGELNVTERSVTAKGIDGSAVSVVVDDDDAAGHAAEQRHVDLVLADGVISDYEQNFILNPPNQQQLNQQLLNWLLQDLFASSVDGEFLPVEVAAMDAVYLGNGIDEQYIAARDAELEAAALFDPPSEVDVLAQLENNNPFAGLENGPTLGGFIEQLLLDGGQVSFESFMTVFAGETIALDLPESEVTVQLNENSFDYLTFENGSMVGLDANAIQFSDGLKILGTAPTQEPEEPQEPEDPSEPTGPSTWYEDAASVELVASIYQFFTGQVPLEQGFEFLILSDANGNDLNDPYYEAFNTENTYINFANNLGSIGEGAATFIQNFGSLTFEETVTQAYELIIGSAAAEAANINPADAIAFFVGSKGFYEAVALERVVSDQVNLDQATKIVAIGSILNEAMKADIGLYADAVNDFVADTTPDGMSDAFASDLFAIA